MVLLYALCAVIGGLATAAILASHGPLVAIIGGMFGGSALTALVAIALGSALLGGLAVGNIIGGHDD